MSERRFRTLCVRTNITSTKGSYKQGSRNARHNDHDIVDYRRDRSEYIGATECENCAVCCLLRAQNALHHLRSFLFRNLSYSTLNLCNFSHANHPSPVRHIHVSYIPYDAENGSSRLRYHVILAKHSIYGLDVQC